MGKKKTITVKVVGGRKRRPVPKSEKEAKARAANRERIKNDPRFTNNQRPGVNNGNPEGHNQYTHPRRARRISEALITQIEEMAPDNICVLANLPVGSSWADVIARAQLDAAACRSLQSAQYVQDVTEGKMGGPGQSSSSAPAPPPLQIHFRYPGEPEPKDK